MVEAVEPEQEIVIPDNTEPVEAAAAAEGTGAQKISKK